jgi:hypothetical protein
MQEDASPRLDQPRRRGCGCVRFAWAEEARQAIGDLARRTSGSRPAPLQCCGVRAGVSTAGPDTT